MNDGELKHMLDEMLPSSRENPTPAESELILRIESEYEATKESLADSALFKSYVLEDDVFNWLIKHRYDFVIRALNDPSILGGSSEFMEALTKLGFMTDWEQVDPESLDPEDYANWQQWQDAHWGNHD